MAHKDCSRCVRNGRCEIQDLKKNFIQQLLGKFGVEMDLDEVEVDIFTPRNPRLPEVVNIGLSGEALNKLIMSLLEVPADLLEDDGLLGQPMYPSLVACNN